MHSFAAVRRGRRLPQGACALRTIRRIPAFAGAFGKTARERTAGTDGTRDEGAAAMKATIERATLLRCLSHVQSVVERRNTIPILSNVLLEAGAGGSLKLMATHLHLQVVGTLPGVSVETPGALTLSAHLLFDIARKLPDGSQVSFETSDNRMLVKA